MAAGPGARPPAWLVRLLGGRILAQGAAELLVPKRQLVLVGSAVDLTHGASMVAAAVRLPAYRRAATVSAADAFGAATARALIGRKLR